jgi:DNA-directed RNA polymerase subunit H (RpoH/RPB5)
MDDLITQDKITKHIFYTAFKTCLEMFADRNYSVPKKLQEISEALFDINTIYDSCQDNNENNISIAFFNGKEKKEFQYILKKSYKHINYLFILYNSQNADQTLNKYTKEFIGDPYKQDSNIEVFDINTLYINPKHHILQPKWRLLNSNEIEDLINRYKSKALIASVCIDDPMCRYYGGKPPFGDKKLGDVFEITRDGLNIFYRKVVSKKMNIL